MAILSRVLAENGEGGDVGCVAIALQHLRGYVGGLEVELGADSFFVLGLEVAEGAYGSGELAYAELFSSGVEAGESCAASRRTTAVTSGRRSRAQHGYRECGR